ncbi:hypothetical protein [Lactococcus sp.]|uniref:hypothetical protein n=1 Tax=Lactococcus sp. TaxID=44273 RepID=UPI0035AE5661
MELKKVIALTTATIALVGTGIISANPAHAYTYGDSNVSWTCGYFGYSCQVYFLDNVAPHSANIRLQGIDNSTGTVAVAHAAQYYIYNAPSGAIFQAISSNYNYNSSKY